MIRFKKISSHVCIDWENTNREDGFTIEFICLSRTMTQQQALWVIECIRDAAENGSPDVEKEELLFSCLPKRQQEVALSLINKSYNSI